MLPTSSAANPFALLMDPQTVLRAVECSERLNRLHSRICRPLDKPLIPRADQDTNDFDQSIDSSKE